MAKIAKKIADAIRQDVAERCRVQRPNLLEFFLGGEFQSLPSVPRNVIKTPYLRNKAIRKNEIQGWAIPAEDIGRPSIESIRLWIKQNLSTVVDIETVSIVQVDDSYRIYRQG